ncbi:uncharacterized protein LOC124447945 [Xenia sp. Carnegie-2017]|uniref:uncharacterized protein LOC124447945 n=1 Tax=Xenia sp. Carnegie-2017 TaxID=2897299 RepID=UPI001F04997B|nr:uncharacterized protein LOC124447945 [Xenia sp. Carnegie-2017]
MQKYIIIKLEANTRELEAQMRLLNHEKATKNHEFKKNLQCQGELCDYNCVLCCLVSICEKKWKFYPCGRHLEKIIVSYYAQLQSPIIDHKNPLPLRCDAFMDILKKSEIVWSEHVAFDFRVDRSQWLQVRIKAWNHISSVDRSVLILGKIYSYENETVRGDGHCVTCNTDTAKKGIIYDSQSEFVGVTNVEEFVKYVSKDMGNSWVKASLTMDENSCSNTPLPPAMEESKGTLSNCKHCNYLLSILKKRDNEITSLSTTLKEYKSTLKERDDEITLVKKSLVQHVSILNQKDKEIASLNASLKQTVSILSQREDEIARLNASLEQKVSMLSQREDEIARLNASLEQKVSMLSQREDEIARLNASLEQKVSLLSQKKNQIALALKERENLKNAGRLCENDCVLCCFVDICKTYISDLPSFCGRSLEKQITAHAVGKKLLDKNDLNCLQLMNILEKTKLVYFLKWFKYPIDPLLREGKIKEAWLAMMNLSSETPALMIGRLMFNGSGHCEWFCRDKNTIFDSQSGVSTKANFESFYIRVQHDKGIAFFGFNISRVQEFINENRNHLKRDSFHDLNYQRVDYGSGVFRETVLYLRL